MNLKPVTDFFTRFDRHQILVHSGSLAFTTALALAPFIIISLIITGLMGDSFRTSATLQMTSLLGPQVSAAATMIIENTQNRKDITNMAGIISFVILLFSAGAIFSQLKNAFNIIKEDPADPADGLGIAQFFKDRLISMGLIIGFIFLAIVSLTVSSALALIFSLEGASFLVVLSSFVLNLLTFALIFSGIYHFVPSTKLNWKQCFFAGTLSSVFFGLGKYVIGIYLGNSAVTSAYGAAGAMVAFLVWVYYTSLVLLANYEITLLYFKPEKDAQHA